MMNAWQLLGHPIDGAISAEEALKMGLLGDWNVRTVPLYAALPEDSRGISRTVPVRERVAVVRDSPVVAAQTDHIGIVSPTYPMVQNEEQVDLLNALVDESGARFVTAGELDAGRKVFVVMALPGYLSIGDDHVESFVATVHSHDGTKPFSFATTPTYGDALLNVGDNVLKVRHTSGFAVAVAREARRALDFTFDYLDWFRATADRLADRPMSQARFEGVCERRFGASEDAALATRTRAKVRLDDMAELFSDANGATAWDGFSALCRWSDQLSPVRGEEALRDVARAQKAALDPSFKNKALAAMTQSSGADEREERR
jgi:hypothetical protein